jgi:MFS family permease
VKSIDSLKALSYKPYRRIFFGAVSSNIGTWVETVVLGIYMQSKTQSATYVAATLAAGFVPQALMGLFSGAIADRLPRKNVLIATNLCASIIAMFLAFSVAKDFAEPALVISLIFVAGFLNAISFPTWQAFLSDIVPLKLLPGALSLMFAQWNLGRIVGPAIAALFVAGGHYWQALAFNAFSFLVVVFVISLVKEDHYQRDQIERSKLNKESGKETLSAGWKYVLSHDSNMRNSFFVFCIIVFWASPFIALIPNVADEVFRYKNLGTALFTTSQGLGAVFVSVALTTLHLKYGQTRVQQVFLASLPFVLIGFGLSPNLIVASPISLFFGLTYLGALTSTTLASQLAAPPELKGRVSAVYMATLGFLFPLSSIAQSFFVEAFGARVLFVSTGIMLFFMLLAIGAFSRSYSLPSPWVAETKIEQDEEK